MQEQRMMTRLRVFAMTTGLLGLSIVPASAINIGGLAVNPPWLFNGGFQRELKLSEDQVAKVTAVADEYVADRAKGYAELEGKIQDRAELARKKRELLLELSNAAGKRIEGTLSGDQAARLRQISIQTWGIMAFRMPYIQEQLKTTPEQQKELQAIFAKGFADRPSYDGFRRAFPDSTPDQWMASVELEDGRTMARLLAALGPDQRARWAEITGPPYKYDPGPLPDERAMRGGPPGPEQGRPR